MCVCVCVCLCVYIYKCIYTYIQKCIYIVLHSIYSTVLYTTPHAVPYYIYKKKSIFSSALSIPSWKKKKGKHSEDVNITINKLRQRAPGWPSWLGVRLLVPAQVMIRVVRSSPISFGLVNSVGRLPLTLSAPPPAHTHALSKINKIFKQTNLVKMNIYRNFYPIQRMHILSKHRKH